MGLKRFSLYKQLKLYDIFYVPIYDTLLYIPLLLCSQTRQFVANANINANITSTNDDNTKYT